MPLDKNFILKLNQLQKLQRNFPNMAAIEAVNFSKERFVRKNWVDKSREAWEKRQKKDKGSLMVKSGRLKRSIRKLAVTRNSVTIGTDVPYAEIHNEGGTINSSEKVRTHSRKRKGRTHTVQAHMRKRKVDMPERRFIGESAVLMRRLERLVEKELKDILK